jgi:hypothetical protein
MTALITETVAAAERAVAGEDSSVRDYCDRLLGDLAELRSGRDEEHVYLATLLDAIGLRKESVHILRAAAASRSAVSRAVLQNAEGMLAAKHGEFERARVLLEQALLAATDSAAVRNKILANLAAVSLMAGSIEDARAWVDQLDAAGETSDPAVSVLTNSVRAALAVAARDRPGLGTAVTALHEASMSRAAELGQHPRAVAVVANMAVAEATAAQASGSRVRVARAIDVLEVAALRLGAEIGADDPETLTVQASLARAKFSLELDDGSVLAMETALAGLARVRQRAAVRGDVQHVAQLERDLASTRQALLQFQAGLGSRSHRSADETRPRLGSRILDALWWIGSVGGGFLAWLSGAQRQILERCPTERPKYAGFGAIILTTATTAAVSMTFALVAALNVKLVEALPVALLWGLFIMCLDRWLLVSLRPQRKISANFLIVIPRLGLSLLFAAIISTPLILQIFQPEINREIPVIQAGVADVYYREQSTSSLSKQIAEQQEVVNRLQQEATSDGSGSGSASMQKLTKQLDQAEQDAAQAYAQWQCELTGQGPGEQTCVQGDGPLAEASEHRYHADQAQIEKYQAEIAALTTQQQNAEGELRTATQSLQAAQSVQLQQSAAFAEANQGNKGLLIRLQALDAATAGNSTLLAARWLVFALFAVIECLPVMVKFIMNLGSPGIYESLLQVEEEEILKVAVWEIGQRERDLIARRRPAPRTFADLGDGLAAEREAAPWPEDSDVL